MSVSVHDEYSLRAACYELMRCRHSILHLNQHDPTLINLARTLEDLRMEIRAEIEFREPELGT